MIKFVLDSYAIIEFFKGSPKWKEYFDQKRSVTTKLNNMEVYFYMLKNLGEENAEYSYDSLLSFEYPLSNNIIKNAMKKRLELKNHGKNISYADAIGYQLALELEAKFVTGDKEFEKLDSVIFIK